MGILGEHNWYIKNCGPPDGLSDSLTWVFLHLCKYMEETVGTLVKCKGYIYYSSIGFIQGIVRYL